MGRYQHTLDRLLAVRRGIRKTVEFWCFACCTAVLVIIIYQVSARYLFHQPLLWAQGTCQLLLMHIVFLGTAIAFANRSHIAIDLLISRLPARGRRIMDLAITGLVNLMLAFFTYCLYQNLLRAYGVYPSPALPKWVFYLPVFSGAVLAWVIVSINFVESLLTGTPGPEADGDV